ncbi:MAG: hypothetical protein WBD34_01285 [Burkholderiaceae bacterium]
MTPIELRVPLTDNPPAVLTMPRDLRVDSLLELEHSLVTVLSKLRRQISAEGLQHGEIEYLSWMPVFGERMPG